MSGSKWCYCYFKGTMKSIIIISVFMLIFPTTALCTLGDWFKVSAEHNSANEWQQWKDLHGKAIYINHDIKKVQRQDPKKFNAENGDSVTELRYPNTIEEKMQIFNAQIDKSAYIDKSGKKFKIRVKRSKILQDSYKAITGFGAKKNLRKMLDVEFENETNIQVKESFAKEWFSVLSKEISDPKKEFFRYVDQKNYQSEINPNFSDLKYFKFIGRVVGAAVYHQILVNINLVKPYYKIMLSQPIELADVQSADPSYYKNLSEADVNILKEYASSIEDSQNMNPTELISEIIQKKYRTSVEKQMSAFLKGFNGLIPLNLLRIFTADELKELIGGVQLIDIDDWKRNTWCNTRDSEENVVQWFWNIVGEFTEEERRRLLQFVVGTSTIPASGFQGLEPRFTIGIDYSENEDKIPTASVCANKITLTRCESEDSLRKLLRIAIEEADTFQLT